MKPIVLGMALLTASCGADVTLPADPEPPLCHRGWELVDGVCQVKEIYFEGGTFTMGRGYCFPPEAHEEEFDDGRCFLSDEPHEVTVEPFYMDAVEFTSEERYRREILEQCPQFSAACIEELNMPELGETPFSPANNFGDDLCEAQGKSIPTESQWEFAASGGGLRTYPWGDEPPSCEVVYADASCPSVGEVAQYPPSPEGVHDLAGNAQEWVLYDDTYTAPGYPDTPTEPCPGEPSPEPCKNRIHRGGRSGDKSDEASHARFRAAHRVAFHNIHGRLRCVRNP